MLDDLESELMTDSPPLSVRKPRLFETGQMKLLVLHLIAQAPKYGYDLMKEIANIVGGGYSPSAGTIYPTLTYLEEQQYVLVNIAENDRKQYCITSAGRAYLQLQQACLDQILCRFDTRKQIQNNAQYLDIKRAMTNLKASLRLKIQHCDLTAQQVHEIAKHIDQAATAIARL